jgi:hypothetical protein
MHKAMLTLLLAATVAGAQPDTRAMRFQATAPDPARRWQEQARGKLFLLMMGGRRPKRVPPDPQTLQREEPDGASYALEELTLQTLPDRRVHCWLAMPKAAKRGATPAIVALHGHDGGHVFHGGVAMEWLDKNLRR